MIIATSIIVGKAHPFKEIYLFSLTPNIKYKMSLAPNCNKKNIKIILFRYHERTKYAMRKNYSEKYLMVFNDK